MTTQRDLHREGRRLADRLRESDRKIVFAESCTGGLVSATLTRIPGISGYLCGSAVVYQVETKHAWLGIPKNVLDDPGPVSRLVAERMAQRVLEETPHADLAVSVTGHLGPGAPAKQDGLVFLGAAVRTPKDFRISAKRLQLGTPDGSTSPGRMRVYRQMTAALQVLQFADAIAKRS